MLGWLSLIVALAVGGLLIYITVLPFFRKSGSWKQEQGHNASTVLAGIKSRAVHHIGVALARDDGDAGVLGHAIQQAKVENAQLTLIHVVDSAPVIVYGEETYDEHARSDEQYLDEIAQEIRASGIPVEIALPHGQPSRELVRYAKQHDIDLLVMGSHGHRLLGDLLLGETVDSVRHGVEIPVLVVR